MTETKNEWRKVVFSDDVSWDDCKCPECGDMYDECFCPGPTQNGVEYQEVNGVLYGRYLVGHPYHSEGIPKTITTKEDMDAMESIHITADLAQVAYEGYASHTGFKSLATGDDLPQWGMLPIAIQMAWIAAVTGVVKTLLECNSQTIVEHGCGGDCTCKE